MWSTPSDPLTKFYAFLKCEDGHSYLDNASHLDLDHISGHVFWTLIHLHGMDQSMTRLRKTITYVKMHSDGWTVSPMDFCVIGVIFSVVGRKYAGICRGDPFVNATQRYVLGHIPLAFASIILRRSIQLSASSYDWNNTSSNILVLV
ncbi:hypothetical protein ARMGADRAFT_1038232 [Armillaria gallica]|uniref:Uncharacterized protein n=1 Tax=Armillaria gallica TaxID=47427 RepID=A0A2H3CWU6_ARMGA|nr:hypothetical protein ARMGADRAFT_1038232 [Armillaria gallica]